MQSQSTLLCVSALLAVLLPLPDLPSSHTVTTFQPPSLLIGYDIDGGGKSPQEKAATQGDEKPPKEKPISWGEKTNGFQLGARIVQDGTIFKVGDTVQFQAFGRNLSGKDVQLTIGNYWKVNYKIQIQTMGGKPIYMERDARNKEMEVAGYLEESLADGATQEISKAVLKISPAPKSGTAPNEDEWVEAVALKPGRYWVRLLSWGVFGKRKPEPASGWIPIEVKSE